MGYGSKYDEKGIYPNLCCHCFDKVMGWMLPQCIVGPMCDECGDAFPIQALLKGGAAAEAEAVMRCLPETRHLRYGFRRMWLHDWKGVYVAKGMGYCTDPCICLPRSIEMVRSYDKRKEVYTIPVQMAFREKVRSGSRVPKADIACGILTVKNKREVSI